MVGFSLDPQVLAQFAAASFRPPPPVQMPGFNLQPPLPPPVQSQPGLSIGEGLAMASRGLKDFLTGLPLGGARDVDPLATIIYGSPRPRITNLGGGWIGGGV